MHLLIETIVEIETNSLEASVIGALHILDLRSARVCLVFFLRCVGPLAEGLSAEDYGACC